MSLAAQELYPGLELHGVDVERAPDLAPTMAYRTVNLDRDPLPYPDQHFDAIIFTHVIEHLQNPLNVAGEIGRTLRIGGLVYVETPNWTSLLVPSLGVIKGGPFNFFDDPTHIRPWTKHALHAFLDQKCRLQVVKVGTVRNLLRVPLDLARTLTRPRSRATGGRVLEPLRLVHLRHRMQARPAVNRAALC
jgi:SAM-dependent methyltransferase